MADNTRQAIIFDFDGTLADSLLVTLGTLYELVHHQPMPVQDVSRYRGMSTIQVLHELKIPLWRALFLKQKIYNAMRDRMDRIALVPGVDEMVRELVKHYTLYIVSSNDVPNVKVFLGRFQIGTYFAKVYGDANPIGKAKTLRQVLAENHLDPASTWYVGDQAWDVKAAHKVGMKAAAVGWGFSNLHVLKAPNPDLLAFSPDELTKHFLALKPSSNV